MRRVQNKFGSGDLHEASDLHGNIYVRCCACMSIWSEFLSWANHGENQRRFVKDPRHADTIIVLGCQVTDLAVLSDLRHLVRLRLNATPATKFYVGGCLARRFDIDLPSGVMRIDNIKHDREPIINTNLIDFANPFWVSDFGNESTKDGKLFRSSHPIRIGVGCNGKCTYCTIKTTRGTAYQIGMDAAMVQDYLSVDGDVVLIADSPTTLQLRDWLQLAMLCKKSISLRNVEPHVCLAIMDHLESAVAAGMVNVVHSPIQSTDPEVLSDMQRDPKSVSELLLRLTELKKLGNVTLATNVIINYKDYPSENLAALHETFDYVSWNPYWDGIWDTHKAVERFNAFFPWSK